MNIDKIDTNTNRDTNEGGMALMFDPRQSVITLAKTNLFKPRDINEPIYYLKAFRKNTGMKIGFVDPNGKLAQTGNPVNVYQLNGHNITSGILVKEGPENSVFSNGTVVLFAGKSYVEVNLYFDGSSDRIRPLLVKNLTQVLCSKYIAEQKQVNPNPNFPHIEIQTPVIRLETESTTEQSPDNRSPESPDQPPATPTVQIRQLL